MSDPTDDRNDDPVPRGAACMEIISESNSCEPLPSVHETTESNIEEVPAARDSPTFQSMIHNLYNPPRRFSTFLTAQDTFQRHRHRHASLPFLSVDTARHTHNDIDLKKMMLESSRRSSLESAYHSQRSDPASRTESASRFELINDDIYFQPTQTYSVDDNLDGQIYGRRDSLSYEAIRSYFLEMNPYAHEAAQSNHSSNHQPMDHSGYPTNRRRRSSLRLSNFPFRTRAHQFVIERQFEDLSNIPDQRQSRSTSIDISGGIDIRTDSRETNEQTSAGGNMCHNSANNKNNCNTDLDHQEIENNYEDS